ncbi:hypothetical protein ACFL07_09720 [Pseudomonadota bacterium]|jgi:hypothetical protein
MLTRIPAIVFLLLLPFSAVANKEMARVITDTAKPVQCIAPIDVYNIDGKLVRKNAMGFDIEPGKHTLVGTARVDSRNCSTFRGSPRDVPALEYEFKAGHTYFIGLNHKAAGQKDWFFEVWRIQEP